MQASDASANPLAQTPSLPALPLASERARSRDPVVVFAAIVVLLLLLSAYFSDRNGAVDEIGLFNPAYVDLHYGKVAYPIYGDFEAMVVHPPLHYKIIGTLMRWGFPYYYAEATPALLMLLFGLLLIVCSPFPAPVRIGLLCGLAAPIAIFVHAGVELFGMRPEGHLNAAWLAALIALESARLRNWSLRWLIAGSFLLAYAAGLHYYAAPALLGLLVYMIWVVKQAGWRGARKPLLAMATGALLFGIPYLLLFVIPEWHPIVAMLKSVPLEGMAQILRTHIVQYHYLAMVQAGGLWLRFPLTWGLPVVLLSTPILAAIPATRGFVLASLPLQLFVLLFAGHKHLYYFIHEMSLYSVALSAGGAILVYRLLDRLHRHQLLQRVALVLAAAILGAGMLWAKWSAKETALLPEPREQEAEVARAAGKEILGPNARVGSRLGMWYASGAAQWYNVSWDLFWRRVPLDFHVADYASYFDALAEYTHMSGDSKNGLNKTLSSWYADGVLHLAGFFFAQTNPQLSYLLLRGTPAPKIRGFALRNDQLYQFQEDPTGDYRVISLACDVAEGIEYTERAPLANFLYLPKADPAQPTRAVLTALLEPGGVQPYIERHPGCRQVQEVHGFLLLADRRALVEKMRREDRPIAFYRNFTDMPTPQQPVKKPAVPTIPY